jgi:hypothetical protein
METKNVNVSLEGSKGQVPLPSNEKILEATSQAKQTMEYERQNNPNLNTKGQSILKAAENLTGATGQMIQEKNADEAFQNFGQHCMEVANRVKKEAEGKQGEIKKAFDRLSNILPRLQGIITQMFTSVDSRKLALEFFSALSDIMGTVSETAKEAPQAQTPAQTFDKLSRDDKRKIVQRLADLYARVGENQAMRDFRQEMFDLYDFFRSENPAEQVDPALKNDLTQLSNEARDLLQRFVPGKDLQAINGQFWSLYSRMNSDPQVQNFFYEMRQWGDNIVSNPAMARDSSQVDKCVDLLDQGDSLIREKYYDDLRSLCYELKEVFACMAQDKFSLQMKGSMMEFREAISGSIVQTLGQLRHVAIPLFKSAVVELPIPRIEGTTDTSKYTLDHMVIKGKELGLEDVSLQLKVGLKDMFRLVLKVKNLQFSVSEINFTYERTSMPKWHDQGVCSATLYMPKFKLRWYVREDKGQAPHFEMDEIFCRIRRFDVSIEEANHKLLDKMIVGLFSGIARTRAENALNESLRKNGDQLTQKFNEFFIEKAVIPPPSSSSFTTPTPTPTPTPAPTPTPTPTTTKTPIQPAETVQVTSA